jgi:DNA invertase Pin-like site-specific DNA recombinase
LRVQVDFEFRKRCEEGIERAKRKGTKFGRPSALDDGEKRVMAAKYASGATMEELAKEYGVGIGSIWRSLQSGTKNKAQEVSYGLT